MDFFIFLAAFLLPFRLRKAINKLDIYPKWNKLLLGVALIIAALFFTAQDNFDDNFNRVLGSVLLLGMLLFLIKEPDFKLMRPFIFSHYPLVAMGLLNGIVEFIAPEFYARWDNYFQFAILAAFMWTFARFANSKKQQEELRIMNERKAALEALVAERTAEITKQKNELQETVKELQATQAQLIQQEKLASLGELTAGIAHEIQNPLNFVNNFSEVSMELIEEMEAEMAKGDTEEASAIAADIKQNLEKIMHHGKRADGIVKGMLQHSRASSNVKEPTNLNSLADEYLRLAYHGLRAKDKSFNAELITHLDQQLPAVNMVSQDVGRVLLNMFTNAFYAVHKKQQTVGGDFKPKVEVATVLQGDKVVVTVRDNGIGIPDAIKDKIMQPFFTTKPAGEGTGLGLSLSYDIIVKAHKGTININSKEGEGSEFVITLPVN